MSLSLMIIKNGGGLWPYLDKDKDKLRNLRRNQAFKATLTQQSDRSVQHNKLFWGGLIKLAADYWEPEAGCVSPNEEAVVNGFAKHLGRFSENPEAINMAATVFLDKIRATRAYKYEAPSAQYQAIHDWILEELGMYDLYLTPLGWKKRLKHINFNAMPTEAEFLDFYQKAFGVVWKFLLSRKFESEEEAHNVIAELSAMGN